MAASTATFSVSIQWTPPGAAVNSGNSPFQVQASYNAQQVGQLDIEIADPPGTIMDICFGSIEEAKILFIRNMASAEIGVRLNGSITNVFNLPAGAEFAYISPTIPGAVPLASAQIVTTVSPTVKESVYTYCFGD